MTLTCVELAAICQKNKPAPKYVLCKIADKYKIKILYLPVSHPELNPIEMIWSMMKDYIQKKMFICLYQMWKNMHMNFLILLTTLFG